MRPGSCSYCHIGEGTHLRRSSRLIASTVGLALTLTACGGQNSSLPGLVSGNRVSTDSSVRTSAPDKPVISIPKLYGDLAYTDAGKRPAKEAVRVSLTLRYNHQAELDAFVANNGVLGAGHGRFLSAAQFDGSLRSYALQEERVVRALERAGFTIVKRFPNRTIVDATARTSVVERFFSTEIHSVHQGKYGERYTNVTPATVPREIAPLVRDVSLNNLVVVTNRRRARRRRAQRTAPQFQTTRNGRHDHPAAGVHADGLERQFANGGFETGAFSPGGSTRARAVELRVGDDRAGALGFVFRVHGRARAARNQRLGVDRTTREGAVKRRPQLLGLPGLERRPAGLRYQVRVAGRLSAQLERHDPRRRSTRPSTTRTAG